jgi:hypothetical protein
MHLDLALVHHPVYNKAGDVITSAVSNLDLHDIARAAKTYGIHRYFIVTPLQDQRDLAERIIGHWTVGVGGTYNPDRKAALELIQVVPTLDHVLESQLKNGQKKPLVVATDARPQANNIGYAKLGEMLNTGQPVLLVFGTAWGLTRAFIEKADFVLAPILGNSTYNHLSVRSAAAIILDRLIGKNQ